MKKIPLSKRRHRFPPQNNTFSKTVTEKKCEEFKFRTEKWLKITSPSNLTQTLLDVTVSPISDRYNHIVTFLSTWITPKLITLPSPIGDQLRKMHYIDVT